MLSGHGFDLQSYLLLLLPLLLLFIHESLTSHAVNSSLQPALSGEMRWPFSGGAGLKKVPNEAAPFDPISGEPRAQEGHGADAGLSRASTGGSGYAALAAAAAEYNHRQGERAAAAPAAAAQRPPSGRAKGSAAAAQGQYDPLLHEWVVRPDGDAQRVRQRDMDRAMGLAGIRCAGRIGQDAAAGGAPACAAACDEAQMAPAPVRNPITGAGMPMAAPRAGATRAGPSW